MAEEEKTPLNDVSSAVQAHITIMQEVIRRMAENSRSCKTWCITIASAVLILVVRIEKPCYVLLALIPTVMFLLLDTYYLALERNFRKSYQTFVEKLHEGKPIANELYVVSPTGSIARQFLSSLLSFSIWLFYLTLALMIAAAWYVMSP